MGLTRVAVPVTLALSVSGSHWHPNFEVAVTAIYRSLYGYTSLLQQAAYGLLGSDVDCSCTNDRSLVQAALPARSDNIKTCTRQWWMKAHEKTTDGLFPWSRW